MPWFNYGKDTDIAGHDIIYFIWVRLFGVDYTLELCIS